MQEPEVVPLDRAALWLGVILTVLTIVSKVWLFPLRWVARQFHRLALWGGRRLILRLLQSDADEFRLHIAALFEQELHQNRETRKLVGALEDAVVRIEEELRSDRYETRNDIAVAVARMSNETREIRAGLAEIGKTMHTLVGVVVGPEEAKRVLREFNSGESP